MILSHIACQEGHIWLLFCYDTFYFFNVLYRSIWIFPLRKFVEKNNTKHFHRPTTTNWDLPTQPLFSFKTTQAQPLDWIEASRWVFIHFIRLVPLKWPQITPGGGWGLPRKGLGHNWLVAEKGRIHETNPVSTPKLWWIPMGSFYSFQHELTPELKKRPRPGYPMSLWPHEEWGPPAASIQQINSLPSFLEVWCIPSSFFLQSWHKIRLLNIYIKF